MGGQARRSLALRFFLLIGLLWLVGFAVFAARLVSPPQWDGERVVDAAIVLTGGAGRLETAAEILRDNKARQVLISGVHSDVSAAQLKRMLNLPQSLVDCCLLLDKRARNTWHNAEQAVRWAQDVQARSLILVTSDYHMPRSYYLLMHQIAKEGADIRRVVTLPVETERSVLHIFTEYHKYLASLVLHFRVKKSDDREET